MKIIGLIFLILSINICSAQKKIDFSGTWQGIITQPGGGLDDNYAFWMSVTQTKDSIHGLTRLELNNSNNFGIIEFKGSIKGNELIVQETKITDENIRHGAFWCIKAYTLTYNVNEKYLTGEWTSTKTCGPGMIYLSKTTIPFSTNEAINNVYMSFDDLRNSLKSGKADTGKKVVMSGVVFKDGSAELNEESKKYLDELYMFLKENPKLIIKISGYTDNVGEPKDNFFISLKRAQAVVDYLVKKGIKINRLQHEAFGETRPMRDNSTENGRLKNNRIEFEII